MPNLSLHVNGENRTVELRDPDEPLLYVLRNALRPDRRQVRLRPRPVRRVHGASSTARRCAPARCPSSKAAGKTVSTIEGLGTPDKPHPLQAAFIAEQAAQCGYCIAGMVMSAVPRCWRTSPTSRARTQKQALAGNLCRCGTHERDPARDGRARRGRTRMNASSRRLRCPPRIPASRRRARRRLRRAVAGRGAAPAAHRVPRWASTLDADEVDGFLADQRATAR